MAESTKELTEDGAKVTTVATDENATAAPPVEPTSSVNTLATLSITSKSFPYKDNGRIDYMSIQGPTYHGIEVDITESQSSKLYRNSFKSCKNSSSFSADSKVSISGVIKLFDVSAESSASYAEAYESETALRQIEETSMSKSLTTKMDLKQGQVGAVVCTVAMLHTSLGVLHVPVGLAHEVLTKQTVQNYAKKFLFDDSWNKILAKFGIEDEGTALLRTTLTEVCKEEATMKKVEPNRIYWLDNTEIMYKQDDDGNVPFKGWADCLEKAMENVKPGMGAVANWSNGKLYIKKNVPEHSRHANRKEHLLGGYTTFWRKPAMVDITREAKSTIDGISEQVGEG